jgi:hypothetical protein
MCAIALSMPPHAYPFQQRRGAGLGELQLARSRSKYFATAPAHAQRALNGAETREIGVVKPLSFPVQDTRARTTGISCFPYQTTTRNFLRFSAPPSLQAAPSREKFHMHASQCNNQMGTEF